MVCCLVCWSCDVLDDVLADKLHVVNWWSSIYVLYRKDTMYITLISMSHSSHHWRHHHLLDEFHLSYLSIALRFFCWKLRRENVAATMFVNASVCSLYTQPCVIPSQLLLNCNIADFWGLSIFGSIFALFKIFFYCFVGFYGLSLKILMCWLIDHLPCQYTHFLVWSSFVCRVGAAHLRLRIKKESRISSTRLLVAWGGLISVLHFHAVLAGVDRLCFFVS